MKAVKFTRDDVIRLLRERRREISRFGVREIGIFGSFARGEQRPDSDVDVLVDMSEPSFDAYMDLLFYLEKLFERKVDLVPRNRIKPILRKRILRETIYVAAH